MRGSKVTYKVSSRAPSGATCLRWSRPRCRSREARLAAHSPCRPSSPAPATMQRAGSWNSSPPPSATRTRGWPITGPPATCLGRAARDWRARRHRADLRRRLYRGAADDGRQADRKIASGRNSHAVRLARGRPGPRRQPGALGCATPSMSCAAARRRCSPKTRPGGCWGASRSRGRSRCPSARKPKSPGWWACATAR